MRKLAFLPMLLLVFAAGCEDDPPTQPTPNAPTFAMSLLSSNEPNFPTPSEASCAGTVRIQLNLTRDAAQVITAATVDFTGTVTGCPTTTTITVAHIHEGAPGVVGPVRVTAFPNGTVTLVGGAGSFSRLGIVAELTPTLAQQIIDNPGAFYFNIHSSANPQGVIRAPLVRTN